jgi:hypothetical protein
MRSKGLFIASAGMALAIPLLGQHDHHPGPTPTPSATLFQSDMAAMTGMTPSDSGASPGGGWHVMDLGMARLSFNRQGGESGGSELESVNWNMVHASRDVGPGRLSLMMMNSLEPVTFAKLGSRELFQTGESYRGQPLVDRQHPHDFFMNLSATYRLSVGPEAGVWIQAAPVGEPALGPTAFMHRASSGENLTAPLGHHWEDSTHIAFHVVTLGGGWKWIAVDASVFRGEEPDEHRWDIEGGRIDSASARARFFIGRGWSAQVSHGFLKNPEPVEPGNTHRTTASVSFGADGDRDFAATLLWGRNDERHGSSGAWLIEGAWQATRADQLYGRAELVRKDAELLATKHVPEESGPSRLARIGAFTLGYFREVDLVRGIPSGVGVDATGYSFPASLEPAYGSHPISMHVFIRLRWGSPHGNHASHAGHAGMEM